MAIDWHQVGHDFQQKYEGTFCRYVSPLTNDMRVFSVVRARVNEDKGPDITLFNTETGEIHLTYNTNAELDFSYPEYGTFQHGRYAVRFTKQYQRQWKKGICPQTAAINCPYNSIYPAVGGVSLSLDTLESAFKPRRMLSLSEGLARLQDDDFSVALTNNLSVGHGIKENEPLLWFDSEPVARIKENQIHLGVPQFEQEIRDYLNLTRDYARVIV